MNTPQNAAPRGRTVSATAIISIVAGIAVLAAVLWKLGVADTWAAVRNVGWAFPAIVALGGLRFLVRAGAWMICLEPPHRLRLRDAFAAVLAGDALGNATPLGPLVGEPAKAAFARRHVAGQPALTALAVENIFYTLATAAMIAAGTIALLFAFELPVEIRDVSRLAIVGMALLIAVSLVVLWKRPALLGRWLPLAADGTTSRRSRLRALEQDIYSFASRRPGALVPVTLLEAGFHVLGVIETHLTLWSILGAPPPLLTSFIVETASRLVVVAFKFVPLQLGVAEAGLAAFTPFVGLDARVGFAFSLVRKGRIVVWALTGAALLVRSGVRPGSDRGQTQV
ncbi:MAG: lysylphosphatidylglycerol synthase transmembrane domain-containing protein [Vicinamibacterales bacterium]